MRKLTARAITEAEVQRLEDFVDQMAETDDPQQVSELAYAYNQELSFLSGNTFAPLIYNSFKTANVQFDMCSVMARRLCTITCSNCWCSCSTAILPGRWRWWRRT